MKKIILLIVISLICFSCEKDYLVPEREVPGWLKEKIVRDEKIIKSQPHLMQNLGAWIRYEFKGEKYYEYDNPASSGSKGPYSHDGVWINTSASPFTGYEHDKCCKTFIWKAPDYHKI